MFTSVGNALLLAFGFGFVIFWHELGHFLAAKWAGVRVEQFAVGFGQALVSWRKGIGFRLGSTQADYQARAREQVERTLGSTTQFKEQADGPTDAQVGTAAKQLGLSETEYRLNWIPLGGYVKMLGQDDLKPGAVADDPGSYTNKSVGKRMVIVSAGVVMNVILAGIGFMALFMIGYKVPPATVGMVQPGSPAQGAYAVVGGKQVPAPLGPGDVIKDLNGRWQSDFDKLRLNTALLIPGEAVPITVVRQGGRVENLFVVPRKPDAKDEIPLLGIEQARTLSVPPLEPGEAKVKTDDQELPDLTMLDRGDTVTAVDGKPISYGWELMDAIQSSDGSPVKVTVRKPDGQEKAEKFPVTFQERFDDTPVAFGGLQMLPEVVEVQANSSARGKLMPGDVVLSVTDAGPGGDRESYDARKGLVTFLQAAGASGTAVDVTVRRGDRVMTFAKIEPNIPLANGKKGLGVALGSASGTTTVETADPVEGSAAREAGVPKGSRIVSVAGKPVATWFDLWRAFKGVKADQPFAVVAVPPGGVERAYDFKTGLKEDEVKAIASNQLKSDATLALAPAMATNKVSNPIVAARWGAGETRDAIAQVYLTVRSMVKGSISPKQISGPVGILHAGYRIAGLGYMKLLWFLSIISANLAVMNFLPIPIVDGGLFTFLVAEKIKGSPISQRTQSIAQAVGFFILIGVFLFATFQDISRML